MKGDLIFIRKKKFRNKIFYYIVKSYTENGKIKQKVIKYLGTAETLLKKLESKN